MEMATQSSVLALRIPGPGEPGWLPSMGSHRVAHDWCDLAAAAVTNDIDYLFMCLFARYIYCKCLFKSCEYSLLCCWFCILSSGSFYIFSVQVMQQISDLQTLSSFHRLSFHLHNSVFQRENFFKSLIESNKSEFSLMDHALISKNPLMNISTQVSSMFSSRGFIIFHVIFSSMIYF